MTLVHKTPQLNFSKKANGLQKLLYIDTRYVELIIYI